MGIMKPLPTYCSECGCTLEYGGSICGECSQFKVEEVKGGRFDGVWRCHGKGISAYGEGRGLAIDAWKDAVATRERWQKRMMFK